MPTFGKAARSPRATVTAAICLTGLLVHTSAGLAQTDAPSPSTPSGASGDPQNPSPPQPPFAFDMGKIDVVGSADGQPGVGGSVLPSEQIWSFDRKSLDQAVNIVPGVISTFDSNGRRNESDVFVRGFGAGRCR